MAEEMWGTDIGALCVQRRWKRTRLVLELRRAAQARGVVLPADESLLRMVRMWSGGDRGLSELYAELLAVVFGVPFATGKRGGEGTGGVISGGIVLGVLGEPFEAVPAAGCGPGATTPRPQHGGVASAVAAGDPLLWVPSETAWVASQLAREDLSMDRREAACAITEVVVGSALLEPLERWLGGPGDGVAAGPVSAVGYQEVEQIENAARLFRGWDHQFGGGLGRKAVVGQVSEVAELLRDYRHPPELARRLFAALAQLAQTAATMSWDSGRGAVAQNYYVVALRAAKEAGDRPFGANVLAGMARQLLYLGRVPEALELVRLAQDGVGGAAPPAVRAMLYTREAWCYARQGRVAAFRRATGHAEEALSANSSGEGPYWIGYFDEAELAGVTGGRLRELAHHCPELAGEAADRIDRAVRLRRPPSLRCSALDLIGLAETRLIQGEAEEAARLGHDALDAAGRTHSDRVRVELAAFRRQAGRYPAVPAVAELRDRMACLLDAQPS